MSRSEHGQRGLRAPRRRSLRAPKRGSLRALKRGGGALEFALVMPILLGFVLAGLDISNLVSEVQRTTSAATAAADLAAQIDRFTPQTDINRVVTGKEIAVLALAAREVARPTDILADGALIVTSVGNTGAGPAVAWQHRWGRAGIASQIGPGNLNGLTIASGEGAVFAEVEREITPWRFTGRLLGLPQTMVVRRVAVRRPRLAMPLVQ
ncbi:TadE/TadG family type IV pilus assembly protein [Sandarakinorhabdus sp.]|uniref:TadE/TadG family type IV pilus assembly protein n=1 Tax=Sandarakinorhabdus sp. TaxID=1916663 RepID=UPI00333F76FF